MVTISIQVFNDIRDQLPTLRRCLSVDLSEDSKDKVEKILKGFSTMCQLPNPTYTYPHAQNQKILFNFGQLTSFLCHPEHGGLNIYNMLLTCILFYIKKRHSCHLISTETHIV